MHTNNGRIKSRNALNNKILKSYNQQKSIKPKREGKTSVPFRKERKNRPVMMKQCGYLTRLRQLMI